MIPTYFPIQKNWRRLKPIFERPDILQISHQDMESYAAQRAEDNGYEFKPRPFSLDCRPEQLDSMDWRYGRRVGRRPAFWQFCCAGACHYLVTTNYLVISELEPDRPWQIATSDRHSTVVDLERQLIFDTNFEAMHIAPGATWRAAVEHHTAELLPVGVCLHPPAAQEAA